MSDPENPRAAELNINSQFQHITKGLKECPKCFGSGELDLTQRDDEHWPVGPLTRMTCDYCNGECEVTPELAVRPVPVATGWGEPTPEPIVWAEPLVSKPIKFVAPPVDNMPLTPALKIAKGWAVFDKDKTND